MKHRICTGAYVVEIELEKRIHPDKCVNDRPRKLRLQIEEAILKCRRRFRSSRGSDGQGHQQLQCVRQDTHLRMNRNEGSELIFEQEF